MSTQGTVGIVIAAVAVVLAVIGYGLYRRNKRLKAADSSNPHYVPTTPVDGSGTDEEVEQDIVTLNRPAPTNSSGYTPVGQPGVSHREPRHDLPGRKPVFGADSLGTVAPGIVDDTTARKFTKGGFGPGSKPVLSFPLGDDERYSDDGYGGTNDQLGVPSFLKLRDGDDTSKLMLTDDDARPYSGPNRDDLPPIIDRLSGGVIGSGMAFTTPSNNDAGNGGRNDGGYGSNAPAEPAPASTPTTSHNDGVGGGFGGGGTTTTTSSDSPTTSSGSADTTSSAPTD